MTVFKTAIYIKTVNISTRVPAGLPPEPLAEHQPQVTNDIVQQKNYICKENLGG